LSVGIGLGGAGSMVVTFTVAVITGSVGVGGVGGLLWLSGLSSLSSGSDSESDAAACRR
jgi:hypothetical protein